MDIVRRKLMFVTIVGETVTVLSLCLDPINMNSVLVIFRVSLVKDVYKEIKLLRT